jgi:hypothetical protein
VFDRFHVSLDPLMIWTDPTGLQWELVDWRFVAGKRKRVPLESLSSQGRAFVPHGHDGAIKLYEYQRYVDYRDTTERNVARQFSRAGSPGSTFLDEQRLRGIVFE